MPRCVRTAHLFDKKWRSDDVRLQEEASFSSLLLPEKILLGLENAGYKTPSPIQLESIPVGLFGRDLLVQAKSGTGKTLVFTVIALESLSEIKYPQVLIMAPTREIAIQICDVVRAVGSAFKGLTCNFFIGGIAVDADIERIHGCQIIIGTPGRLKHLISLGILATNSIRLLVLDEADILLESSFKDDLDYIFVSLPKEKQVIATSATYPRELRSLTHQYFRKVYLARLNCNELTLLGMVHYIQVLELPKMSLLAYKAKLAALEKVVTSVQFTQCLVFCNLISRVESLCYDIRNWGFTSTFISSAKEQCDRIRAIECLKRFKCKILVTSDVTSRGIDAENVDLVVNFDKPLSTEVYFHRCGRAGRYGAKGVAITFLEKAEVLAFEQMKLKHNLKAYNLPDPIPVNLINLRPRENNSSNESSEEDDEDLSDDESKEDSNDLNNHSNNTTNETKRKNNTCKKPSTVSNGHISSNLNGHLVENNGVNEPANKNTNCEFDSSVECNDEKNEKGDCVSVDLSKSSDSDFIMPDQNLESDINTNGTESFECKSNKNIASECDTNESVKEKNLFLEYLESGPKNTQSLPSSFSTLDLDSTVVYNNISTDHVLSNEFKSDNIILEAENSSIQKDIQLSSETQCLNSVDNVSNNNGKDPKDLNLNVTQEEITDNSVKLVPPSDALESFTQVGNNTLSTITSTSALSDTLSDKVPKESLLETKNKFVPSQMQFSETQCSNNVDNTPDNNGKDPKDLNQNVTKEIIENSEKLVLPLDALESVTQVGDKALSVITSTSALPNTLSDKDPKGCLHETKNKFIPNKIQLSVGKFLLDHMDNSDVNNLLSKNASKSMEAGLSSTNADCFTDYTGTEQDITTLKDIRRDLTDFYSKVYKAYRAENISDAAFEDIKAHVKIPKDEKIVAEVFPHAIGSNEKIISEAIQDELIKENDQNPAGLKLCDISKDCDISNKNNSPQENNTTETSPVFDQFVFKENSADSSDSSDDEDSYLALKDTFSVNKSEKANYQGNSHASQKRETEKCINMKKKKFSANSCFDKRQHSSLVDSKKVSKRECSNLLSSDEDTENKLQELYGARQKTYNGKRNFKQETNNRYQAKNTNFRNGDKVKPSNVMRISTERKRKNSREASENQLSSLSAHNTSTPYFKGSKTANHDSQHSANAANYKNFPSINYSQDQTTCAENYGNFPFTSQPYGHTTSIVNHGNISSMNHPHECQLPSYHYHHQINKYAQPNQVSHVGHSSHHQFGNANVYCHNCSANWYHLYMKQWRFIHSSLF